MLSKWQRDLLAGVPTARSVELPGGNVNMFLSNEADILPDMRTFAAALQQQTALGGSPSKAVGSS